MGISKSFAFSPAQNRVAQLARALSHPARVAILELLLSRKACVCGDIVEELPLSQSTVSQHLKELKEVGLIRGEIEGVRVCYCIDLVAWEEAQRSLTAFLQRESAPVTPGNTCC